MFTRGSSRFGSWRPGHRSQRKTGLGASYALVIAMASMAFVAWLTFFLTFKIRGDFYFFETSELNLPDASRFKGSSLLVGHRPPAFALGLLRKEGGRITVLFDSGVAFEYPHQRQELEQHVQRLALAQEFAALLTKEPSPSIGRVQIWADQSLSFAIVRELTQVLSSMGFDEFDFAMTLYPPRHGRLAALSQGASP